MAEEKRQLKIVFMGTPDFAVPCLEILIEHGYEIAGVITAPDKPAGRGRQLKASPVKETAEKHGLKVLQPTNLKDKGFLEELKSLRANLFIVVAFRMLPEAVWQMPEIGTFNLHASLLPDYRGAAPINWAIIKGEKTTGVTTFFLKHEIDTGDILLQEKVEIGPETTAGELHDQLMNSGADLVLRTVQGIERNSITEKPQGPFDPNKKAPKIFPGDTFINWDENAQSVHDFIRGLSPYPGAKAHFNGLDFKILRAEQMKEALAGAPGAIKSDGKHFLQIACHDHWINVLEIQAPGKKRMGVKDFLNGNGLELLGVAL
jgi:methionyl-tRNA formyltransferase